MKNKTFRESVKRAIIGFFTGLKTEKNFKYYTAIAAVFFAINVLLGSTLIEYAIFFVTLACAFSAELFNTAIEHISNIINPEYDKKIKTLKDIAAGGVLAMGLGFFISQGLILIPKVIEWI